MKTWYPTTCHITQNTRKYGAVLRHVSQDFRYTYFQVKAPLYIRDCIEGLLEQEDRDKFEAAIYAVTDLITKNPTPAKEVNPNILGYHLSISSAFEHNEYIFIFVFESFLLHLYTHMQRNDIIIHVPDTCTMHMLPDKVCAKPYLDGVRSIPQSLLTWTFGTHTLSMYLG